MIDFFITHVWEINRLLALVLVGGFSILLVEIYHERKMWNNGISPYTGTLWFLSHTKSKGAIHFFKDCENNIIVIRHKCAAFNYFHNFWTRKIF